MQIYPDYTPAELDNNDGNDNDEPPVYDIFDIYFSDPLNIVVVISMIAIITITPILIWKLHKKREQLGYEEFKNEKKKDMVYKKKKND